LAGFLIGFFSLSAPAPLPCLLPSGREIAKLAIAWQAAAYGSPDATFTPELLETVLAAHGDQKRRKMLWNAPTPGMAYRK